MLLHKKARTRMPLSDSWDLGCQAEAYIIQVEVWRGEINGDLLDIQVVYSPDSL